MVCCSATYGVRGKVEYKSLARIEMVGAILTFYTAGMFIKNLRRKDRRISGFMLIKATESAPLTLSPSRSTNGRAEAMQLSITLITLACDANV